MNTDQIQSETDEISRIGSDYDAETADLVRQLLAGGYTVSTLAVALTVDDDTLRRWRRGVQASHLARKLMRTTLILRRIAPGLLAESPGYTVAELVAALDGIQGGVVTSLDDLRRKLPGVWRDGATAAADKPGVEWYPVKRGPRANGGGL